MSTVTTFLGLTKPAGIEQFNLATYNNNLDAIDAGIVEVRNRKRHVEYRNAGFAVAGGLVNWDAGPMSVDAANTFNGGFVNVTSALSGAINITEAGLYVGTAVSVPDGSPGNAVMILQSNMGGGLPSGGAPVTLASAFTNGNVWETSASFNRYMPANSYLRVVLLNTTARTHVTRISLTKLAD